MHNLTNLSVADLAQLSRACLDASRGAQSMEGCADQIVRHFYDSLVLPTGERACVLVRFFKTHSLADLEPTLRDAAAGSLGEDITPSPALKCLTLLATAGDEPEWNSRHSSRGHRVIPLPSAKMVEQFPMISQLITQLGFKVSDVVAADPDVVVHAQRRGAGVFFVPSAAGSPHIPAQSEFVVPYGVRSVVGFGDVLPSGNLFVVVLFTRAAIQREKAEMLDILSVGMKAAVLKFDYGTVFAQVS